MAWTTKDFDETCLGKCLPFPILADHTQALTRKFDLLDSNQGTAKHAYLILDPKGAIRHKQIGDGKVAFNVDILNILTVIWILASEFVSEIVLRRETQPRRIRRRE